MQAHVQSEDGSYPVWRNGAMIFDVGANRGDFALAMASRNLGLTVVAVEPVPELCDIIRQRAREAASSNLLIRQVAIAPKSGDSRLNVAAHDDWGISSLHDLSAVLSEDPYWQHRPDLHFDRSIAVQTVTLAALIADHAAQPVNFIKIDVQGSDLEVLRSAGEAASAIQAGMLEVASTRFSKLYDVPGETLADAYRVLDEMGLEAYAVKPNDPACNEVNVYFCRKGGDWKAVERQLGLTGVALYDGRHYWHSPSSSPFG